MKSAKWIKFTGQSLTEGDEVRISPLVSKLGGKIGVFERNLRQNFSVIVDGIPYSISPHFIDEYRERDASNLADARSMTVVHCDETGLHDCKEGDYALFFRGKFDVVKIISLDPLMCKALDGRGKGQIYQYKPSTFVQKLDSSRFRHKVNP